MTLLTNHGPTPEIALKQKLVLTSALNEDPTVVGALAEVLQGVNENRSAAALVALAEKLKQFIRPTFAYDLAVTEVTLPDNRPGIAPHPALKLQVQLHGPTRADCALVDLLGAEEAAILLPAFQDKLALTREVPTPIVVYLMLDSNGKDAYLTCSSIAHLGSQECDLKSAGLCWAQDELGLVAVAALVDKAKRGLASGGRESCPSLTDVQGLTETEVRFLRIIDRSSFRRANFDKGIHDAGWSLTMHSRTIQFDSSSMKLSLSDSTRGRMASRYRGALAAPIKESE